MRTVLVDVDGTIAHMHPEWYKRYNADYNDNLTEDMVTEWGLEKFVKPECGKHIFDYLADLTLYDEVKPYDGALYVINELKKRGYYVCYVSAGVAGALAKFDWLVREGFITTGYSKEDDFIVAKNKTMVQGQILIDDYDQNVIRWADYSAFHKSIMMDRPWNIAVQKLPVRVDRANSWQKVLNHFNMWELGYE